MQEFNQLTPHPGQFRKFRQPENAGSRNTDLQAADTAWRLWTVMGRFFEPLDPEERGGTIGYVDSSDRFDD